MPVHSDGTLRPYLFGRGIIVDRRLAERLIDLFSDPTSYEHWMSMCSPHPRHAFVFFDELGRPVGDVLSGPDSQRSRPKMPGTIISLTEASSRRYRQLCLDMGLAGCGESE